MEKDLVEYIAKSIVSDPSSVRVSETSAEESVVLELRVAPNDIGRVIGKNGNIAKAVRTLLQAAASRTGKRAVLEIVD
jgi:predicted RNA-binding protein YlqC (UPF0109 family)